MSKISKWLDLPVSRRDLLTWIPAGAGFFGFAVGFAQGDTRLSEKRLREGQFLAALTPAGGVYVAVSGPIATRVAFVSRKKSRASGEIVDIIGVGRDRSQIINAPDNSLLVFSAPNLGNHRSVHIDSIAVSFAVPLLGEAYVAKTVSKANGDMYDEDKNHY